MNNDYFLALDQRRLFVQTQVFMTTQYQIAVRKDRERPG